MKPKPKPILEIVVTLVFAAGCGETMKPPTNHEEHSRVGRPNGIAGSETVPDLTERDADIVRFVLAEEDDSPGDRIYFLTSTPMDDWGDKGNWNDLPKSFHGSIASLRTKYRIAHNAYLKDGRVLERRTNAGAWMKWISIKRWISDTVVEVESGVWCCPLGGGASTIRYEKVDGRWHIKSLGQSWVS